MKLMKRIFKNRFTKQQGQTKEVLQNPNRCYIVGRWKSGKITITTTIIFTDGLHFMINKKTEKQKCRVLRASYVVYQVEIYKRGQVYQKRFVYHE